MGNLDVEYCKCKDSSGVYSDTEIDCFGYWLRCSDCNKLVEDSFRYYNESDIDDI